MTWRERYGALEYSRVLYVTLLDECANIRDTVKPAGCCVPIGRESRLHNPHEPLECPLRDTRMNPLSVR